MSQDAEDGPTLMGYLHTRAPMNQEDFDRLYGYNPPENKYSETVRRITSFFGHYAKPFRSPKACLSTILKFTPIFSWLPTYSWTKDLIGDISGGCTLAIIHIPQGIAYSVLAGLPPIIGLYISFFPPLFYMIFGTAKHNSIGSFAVVALMTRLAVDEFATHTVHESFINGNSSNTVDGYTNVQVASTLTFTIGIVMLLMAVLRLEFVTAYFSDAVVGGFSTGAAFHVFVSQLKDFFGLSHLPHRSGAGNFFLKLYDICVNIPQQFNYFVMLVSAAALTFLLLGKNVITPFVKKRVKLVVPIPFELILLVLATGLSAIFHFHSRHGVDIVGPLPKGFPAPALPVFSLLIKLIPSAITISVVVTAVHISLGKIFGKRLGYTTDAGQELYALGFTSIFSSVFPMYPVSCSLSRTVVSVESGTKSQLSTVFSSVILAAVILWLGPMLRTLPMCILSTVIMVALTNMLKKVGELKRLWPLSKTDFFIWLVSFAATLAYDVSEGLGIAIAFALLTTVFRTQWPRWHYLSNLKSTNDFRDSERYTNVLEVNGICIFRFDAPLLFTNVESFKDSIHRAALRWKNDNPATLKLEDIKIPLSDPESTITRLNTIISSPSIFPTPIAKPTSGLTYRHFVVDCSGFTFVDTMGVNALKEIFNELRSHMILVYFAAAKAPVRELFHKCGFYQYVPKSNFYPTIRDAVAIARQRRDASTLHLLEELSLPYDPLDEQINIHAVQ